MIERSKLGGVGVFVETPHIVTQSNLYKQLLSLSKRQTSPSCFRFY